MDETTTILICGAGPTGLMLAAQLLRYTDDFVIFDKKNGPTTESRALAVQARSMEIYEQMGLAAAIRASSADAEGLCFWRNGRRAGQVRLKNLGRTITPFDTVTIFEQSKNESLLYGHLRQHRHEVRWHTEFTGYEPSGDGYRVAMVRNGETVFLQTRFLIACDGASSAVRSFSGMRFEGGTYEHLFYVADTHVSAKLCDRELNFFMATDAFHLLFPMRGSMRYRVIGILPGNTTVTTGLQFSDVLPQIRNDVHRDLGFHDTPWFSTYRLHHRKVASFRKGNVFFCGDAAHVHSPAGGQGMNTGLQDAYNLAWKLALAAGGRANENILDTYHEERNPVAERLLRTTDRLFNIMAKDTWLHRMIRMHFAPLLLPRLLAITPLRRTFFRLLSQTGIRYTGSRLSNGKAGRITGGMRFPYCILMLERRQRSIYEVIREEGTEHFLVISYRCRVTGKLPFKMKYCALEENHFNDVSLRRAGLPVAFFCVVRPDLYIGYISGGYHPRDLQDYAEEFLK